MPVEELIANDLEFHRLIASGSGNLVLASLLDGIAGPTTRARVWRGLTEDGAVERTRDQHRAICEAIAARDLELARSWMTVHVAGVERWLRDTLSVNDAAR
ncbi:FCD domain-containing protein [Micromonospora zamorensis]|uniref:FadR/GntR family transcriptional regulator n=1 Tax=Micromonospora zamorensis TaxID=709883 RepID=UPI0033E5D7AF